jgi:hypothetical protein
MKSNILICITAFIVCILISSCAIAPMDITFVPNKTTYYSKPEIGTKNTVYIGETLLKEGRKSDQIAIYLLVEYGKIGWTAYHHTGQYKRVGLADDYILYQGSELNSNGISMAYSQILEDKDGNCYLRLNYDVQLLQKSEYIKKDYTDGSSDNFEQNLIYTGRDGDILKLSYREFYNDMARASYTIDATYDITEENIIRFRGASFEVLEANNQSITYKLLSGFKSK